MTISVRYNNAIWERKGEKDKKLILFPEALEIEMDHTGLEPATGRLWGVCSNHWANGP